MTTRSQNTEPRNFIKRGVFFAFLGFSIPALILILYSYQRGAEEHYVAPRLTTKAIENSKAFLDSDNDGLKDWEEAIYQTKPNEPDTDGDGSSDGEEVAAGRDPLKAGPKDQIRPKKEEGATAPGQISNLPKGANITEALFAQVLSNNGLLSMLNKDTAAVSNELLSYIDQIQKPRPAFSEETAPSTEIVATNNESTEAIKEYFNSVASIYEKHINPLARKGALDESKIIYEAVHKKDSGVLRKIGELKNAVEKIKKDISLLPAPKLLLLFHKKEIWYLGNTIEELNLIQGASVDDPLYLLMLLSARNNTKKEVTAFRSEEIPNWAREHSVFFGPLDKATLLYPKLDLAS